MKPVEKRVLAKLDIPSLVSSAQKLLKTGRDKEAVVLEIIRIIDALIPWAILVPGPIGAALEIADGPIARAVALYIVEKAEAANKPKAKKA
jgi:hypothetical protein